MLMVEKGLDFGYPWSKQPEALKANLMDAVAPSSFRLTSRLKRSTLPLLARCMCLSLLWLVKPLTTIDTAMRPTKKTKTLKPPVHANEVAHQTQTPANVTVVHQICCRRIDQRWDLSFGNLKVWKG